MGIVYYAGNPHPHANEHLHLRQVQVLRAEIRNPFKTGLI
jgi:hypothetical protein